jgi:hypothetical protein
VARPVVLIYGTGGVAFGGFNTDFTLSAPNFVPPFFATANRSTTRVGCTAGADSNMPSPTIGRSLLNTAFQILERFETTI